VNNVRGLSFSVAGPRTCNYLPTEVRLKPDVMSLKDSSLHGSRALEVLC